MSSSKRKESLCKLQSSRLRGDHGQDAFLVLVPVRVGSQAWCPGDECRTKKKKIGGRERCRSTGDDGTGERKKENREWNCFSSSASSVIFFSSSIYFFHLFLALWLSRLYVVCYAHSRLYVTIQPSC